MTMPPIKMAPPRRQVLTTEQGRSIPNVQVPMGNPLAATNQPTEIFPFFTKADGVIRQLYTGDRTFAQVTLVLETAGPVTVSNKQVGNGALLQTGVPYSRTFAKGTILYISATSINRISVSIEPVPWLEQVLGAQNLENSINAEILNQLIKLNTAIENMRR